MTPRTDPLDAARRAVQEARAPAARFDARLRYAQALLLEGEVGAALREGEKLERAGDDDPRALSRVGDFHTQCGRHRAAHRCHTRALAARPDDPGLIYNVASSDVALGRVAEAEAGFERVIALDPEDHDAWQNRSTLRRWTEERNHVEALRSLAATLPEGASGMAPVAYALAKELEDLECFDESFAWLQRGASARRRHLSYDIGEDEATLARIEQTFDGDWLAGTRPGEDGEGALFVLGLPRSGTTLTDRMLSAHPAVASLGEVGTLALAVTRMAGLGGDKASRVARAAGIDPAALGAAYQRSNRGYGRAEPWLVDKTPLNFLYLGLLHRALPRARVIHLRRHPLDSCYAIYKTLFRMGYPFSYSLQETGRYYLAYHRLMAHWRRTLPGVFLDVDYERLTEDPERELRRILEYVGLPWDPACLAFHRSADPAATASAVQVREPVHRRSVGRWRCYERQLAPLAGKLAEAGVAL